MIGIVNCTGRRWSIFVVFIYFVLARIELTAFGGFFFQNLSSFFLPQHIELLDVSYLRQFFSSSVFFDCSIIIFNLTIVTIPALNYVISY